MDLTMKLFSEEEQTTLFKSGKLTPEEEDAISSGKNMTLGLVIKAKRILEFEKIVDYTLFATKTEVDLLIEEVNYVLAKQFLIYRILERKGLVSLAELDALTKELNDAALGGSDNESNTKAKINSTGSGRKASTKKKSVKAKSKSGADDTSISALRVPRARTSSRKTTK